MRRFVAIGLLIAVVTTACAAPVRISGSAAVSLVVEDAAKILRDEQKLETTIAGREGSGAGISALGERDVQVAMTTRPVTAEEQARYPDIRFAETKIGEHAVALAVAEDVWESGIHALTKQQARDIYEGKIKNWKQVGGKDGPIIFFNADQTDSVWQIFATWAYGDMNKAPIGKFAGMETDALAREALEKTPGSMTLLSLPVVDSKKSFALAVKTDDGKTIDPTLANIASKTYPLSRPLMLYVHDKPVLGVKMLFDFLLSPRGQELMKKQNYFGVTEIKAAAN